MTIVATGNLFIPDVSDVAYLNPSVIALVVSSILAIAAWAGRGLFISSDHLIVLCCLACFVPGFVQAGNNSYAHSKLIGLAASALILFIGMQLLQDERRQQSFLVWTATLGVLVTIELYGFGVIATSGRATIAGLNEIGVGRMGTLAALVILAFAMNLRGRRRIIALAFAGATAFVSTSTGSRGPLLAALVAVLVTTLITRPASRLTRVLIVAGICAAVFVAVTFLGDASTADRLLSSDSSNRSRIWAESLQTFLAHPFGIGFGNLYEYITVDASMATTGYSQYSHNMLLEAASEGGVTALVGLIGLLVFSFLGLRLRSRTATGELMLAVFFYAVANALLSSDLVGSRLMWVMIAAGSCLANARARTPDSARRTRPADRDRTENARRLIAPTSGRRAPRGRSKPAWPVLESGNRCALPAQRACRDGDS